MELQILDAIQQIRTPLLDVIVPMITMLGEAGILWILMAVIMVCIPKTRRCGMTIGIALVIDLLLCNCILKPLVARTRPCEINQSIELLIKRPWDYSFPSGHTAASFAAAFSMLFTGYRRIGWASVVVSVLIAFSRLYLYVHFPTDVLAGVLIGLICAVLSCMIMQRTELESRVVMLLEKERRTRNRIETMQETEERQNEELSENKDCMLSWLCDSGHRR